MSPGKDRQGCAVADDASRPCLLGMDAEVACFQCFASSLQLKGRVPLG